MEQSVYLLVFEGGPTGSSEIERVMTRVREAVTLDNIERFADAGQPIRVDMKITLVTDRESLGQQAAAISAGRVRALIEAAPGGGQRFHLGEWLRRWADDNPNAAVIYMGGASGCVLSPRELAWVAGELDAARRAGRRALISNNMLSSDIVGMWPASMLTRAGLALPRDDNGLALAIQETCGVPIREMPETVGTRLDVDTPPDAVILASHPAAGPRVRAAVGGHVHKELSCVAEAVRRARTVLTTDYADVVLAGRIGPNTVAALNRALKARLRVYSEERGMKALGRGGLGADGGGRAVSLLGMLCDLVGPSAFFRRLADMCQAAFLDTRVLFAHAGAEPSRADRFWSDALRPENVEEPFVRRFTEAACEASFPVVLGGHSLVCGGIRALAGEHQQQEGSMRTR